ncbi:MAG: hypothetical protein LBT00_10190 [Spirochaetaceae bacterium]|nr:hypothetical protein [Spirochaetaceae bacterium]
MENVVFWTMGVLFRSFSILHLPFSIRAKRVMTEGSEDGRHCEGGARSNPDGIAPGLLRFARNDIIFHYPFINFQFARSVGT